MSKQDTIVLLKAWAIARQQKSNLFNEAAQFVLNNLWGTANVIVVVLLVIIEIIIPLKKSALFSRSHYEDVFWLFTTKLVSFNLWSLMIYKVGEFLSHRLAGYNINLEDQSLALQFFVFFLGSDLVSFLSHRFLHKNDYLWKFHQLHHSTETLTTLSAFRHHWFEDLYYGVCNTALACVFIVNPQVRLAMAILISFACYFQHANLKIRFGAWVDLIFITPLNHRWHHSQISFRPKGQNFGLFLSIWDRWFASYYVPETEPVRLGTDEDYPKTLAGRLIYPFIK